MSPNGDLLIQAKLQMALGATGRDSNIFIGRRSLVLAPGLETSTLCPGRGEVKTAPIFVHRKDTHMDQYLHLSSNHPLEQKRGVVKTQMHRLDTIVSDEREKVEEKSHVKYEYIGPSFEWLPRLANSQYIYQRLNLL